MAEVPTRCELVSGERTVDGVVVEREERERRKTAEDGGERTEEHEAGEINGED